MLTLLPAKARIRVLLSVPIMSRPTWMPAMKSSFLVISGFCFRISDMELLTDMATSITAPILEIRRPEKSSPPTWIRLVFQSVISVSISDTLYPVIPERILKSCAEIPAQRTPSMVPRIDTTVFLVGPPIRYMVTTVVMAHTKTAAQKGDSPRYTRGR